MAPENQGRIKALVDRLGPDDLIMVLGSSSPEALEVAAQTVTTGDPSYAGPLAGVSLGRPVVHILEDDIKEQIEPSIYQQQIGFIELSIDTEAVKEAMQKVRG